MRYANCWKIYFYGIGVVELLSMPIIAKFCPMDIPREIKLKTLVALPNLYDKI
jgi:hypothetical protein